MKSEDIYGKDAERHEKELGIRCSSCGIYLASAWGEYKAKKCSKCEKPVTLSLYQKIKNLLTKKK